MRCEACNNGRQGIYREDYDQVLCDTHAEIPQYGFCEPQVGVSLKDLATLSWAIPALLCGVLIEMLADWWRDMNMPDDDEYGGAGWERP